MSPVRKPGPCLSLANCGTGRAYNTGCRGEDCYQARKNYRTPANGMDREILRERRGNALGLAVVDSNAAHPARARWAALIARIGDAA